MIFKVALLLSLFFSTLSASPFDWVADSVLISQTSIHRFERYHKKHDKTSFEYQTYIASIWDNIKAKVTQTYRDDLVLTSARATNFVNVLRSRNRHRDIVALIELQRDVLGDSIVYAEHIIEAYINLKDWVQAQREIEEVSLKERINHRVLKDFMHKSYVTTAFCEECFVKYKPQSAYYNKMRLLHIYYTKPEALPQIILSDYSANKYDDIISEIIAAGIRDSLNKEVIHRIYLAATTRVERAFTVQLKAALFVYTSDFGRGYAIFESMEPRARGKFLDAFADSMFIKLGYNGFVRITNQVPVGVMGKKALRYLYASYKLSGRQDDFISKVLPNIASRDIHSYFYFWHTLFMSTLAEGGENYVQQYLTTRVNDIHYNDFLLWNTIIKNAPANQREQFNAFVEAFLTRNTDSALKYIDILKQYGIEYEILLSFPESELRRVQYSYKDIVRWYNALKHIEFGRLLMLLSEQFFLQKDLYRFYKEKFDTEADPLWQKFIGSRLAELSSLN